MKAPRIVIAVVALLALLVGGGTAHAVDHLYVSGPVEQFRGYTVPAYAIAQGDSMTYLNLDIATHDVVADGLYGPDTPECALGRFAPGQCPLFWTPLIGLGERSPVYGIAAVRPGVYPFKCTIHGAMKGVLVVAGA